MYDDDDVRDVDDDDDDDGTKERLPERKADTGR